MAIDIEALARVDETLFDLFFDSIDGFPAQYQEPAKEWLSEADVARRAIRELEANGLAALSDEPPPIST